MKIARGDETLYRAQFDAGDMGANSPLTIQLVAFENDLRTDEYIWDEGLNSGPQIDFICIEPVSYTHLTLPTN